MASHHHFHHPTPPPCCCCCPPPPPDPHLHHHHPPPPPQTHLYAVQTHLPNLPQPTPHFQEIHFQEEPNISALLRRIAALETALRRRSSAPSSSLRHAAAQTIQTHFRAFLLNRSRTLRQLKELATIKSQLGLLKSRSQFDSDLVYRKASALLVKLEDIQGCDPMIRDGKKSLSRDLNSFLDYIDGFVVERVEISSGVNVRGGRGSSKLRELSSVRKMDSAKGGGLKRVSEEKLRGLLERIDKLAVELSEEEGEEDCSPVRRNLNSRVLSGARNGKYGGSRSVNVEKLRGLVDRKDELAVELDEEDEEETGSPVGVGSDLDSRILSIAQKLGDVKVKLGGAASTKQRSVVQPKKKVSFAEDGKVFRLVRRNREPYLEEEDCDETVSVDARELKDDICREVEEIGVSSKEVREDEEDEGQSEDGGSSHGSEGDLRSYPIGKR